MTNEFTVLLKRAVKALRAAPIAIAPATRSADSTHSPIPLPSAITQVLRKVSAAKAGIQAREGLLVAASVLLAGLLVTCLADWLTRTPQPIRIFLFVIQLLVVLAVLWLRVIRPLTRKPSDRESALLLQKKFPALSSAPISALELSCGHGRSLVGARALIERLGLETAEMLRGVNPSLVASPNAIKRLLKIAAALFLLNAVWVSLLWPESQIWLARWSGQAVAPPTRTIVRDVTGDLTVQSGSNVELRARAEGVIPKAGSVRLEFTDGTITKIPAQASLSSDGTEEFSAIVPSAQTPFRYTFHLNDGEGAQHRVAVVILPTVAEFTVRETFPEYTKLKPKEHGTGNLTFLAGSKLEITVKSTQDLQRAAITLVGTDQKIPLEVSSGTPRTATGTFKVPLNLSGLSFPLVNTDGVASAEDTVFRASSTEDKPPILTLLNDSSQIESLTPDGNLDLVYSCTDDFGVSRIELRYAIAESATAGAPPEEEFQSIPLAIPERDQATFNWKPGSLAGVVPGKTVFFYLEAADNRTPDGPGIKRTETRSFSIVTPAEKVLETIRRANEAAERIRKLSDAQLDAQSLLKKKSQPPSP